MDYEKKYKEALERARQFSEKPYLEDSKCIVDYIFPELKESEDERIRKALIEMVHDTTEDELWVDYGIHKEEALAWLEAQGEQKPAEFDDTNAKRMFIKALERVEEQNNKGYKLTDCDKNSWWEDFKTYCCYIEIQKPAWNKEDEKMINKLIAVVELYYGIGDDLEKQMCLSWLKSLKDRVQPKWEGSEEDEKMIRALVSMCDVWATSHQFYPKENKEMEALKTWLKSLRPQSTWKPSDEQIEALDDFIYAKYPNVEKHGAAVKSLYQDLKKLREE